jgi:hypothetical protein
VFREFGRIGVLKEQHEWRGDRHAQRAYALRPEDRDLQQIAGLCASNCQRRADAGMKTMPPLSG